MELLKGQDLRQRIKEVGILTPGEAVAIALEVTDALIAAHEHQILHRDLKPENIFLERQAGGKIRIRLLDFGLAKVLKRGKTANTNPEVAVGTPQYMAPEQILEQPLDARTDIYALGVVLYHMLAGRVPFNSKVYSAVLMRHVQDQPPPIAEHRGKPVPPGLDAVVMRCLEKKAGSRFQSAKDLRDALRVSLLEEAVPTLVLPKARPQRGRSVSLVVVALLAVLGVGGGVLVGWLSGFGAEDTDAPSVVSLRPLTPPPRVDARPPDAKPVVHQPHPDAAPVVAIKKLKKLKRPQRPKPKPKRREPQRIHGLIDPFAK
jgi:serine/threonine protein kinase